VKVARTSTSGFGPSKAIRKYMDGKISSTDYVREARKETERQVERDLKSPKRK
jgi:hypothetical protein